MITRENRSLASRLGSTAVAVAALGLAAVAVSQDQMDFEMPEIDPAEHQIAPAFDSSDMDMEAYQKASMRSEHHEMLDKMTGDYTVTMKYWLGGEDSGMPTVSEAESTIEWVLDGKHLRETFRGTVMGQPFEGHGMTSYDNYSGQYVSYWADSMSTAPSYMKGHASADGGAIVLFGEMDEPMMGVRGKTIQTITRMVDEDTHVMEMHDLHMGESGTKVMELTYKRQKN
jgi:hypothetical protein